MDDPSSTQFLVSAVGTTLNSWSHVEIELGLVFEAISGTDANRSHIIMGSVIALDARLQICENLLASMGLSDELKLYWSRCYNRIKRQAKKRNEAAHFTITYRVDGDGNETDEATLFPYFSLGKVVMQPERVLKPLTAREMLELSMRFLDTAEALRWLRNRLLFEQGKLEEAPEPASDLVRHFLRPDDPSSTNNEPPPQSSRT